MKRNNTLDYNNTTNGVPDHGPLEVFLYRIDVFEQRVSVLPHN